MLKPGDVIDVWVVDRPLGQGGMGSVYRCHNRQAKRILAAVKVLDPSLTKFEQANQRFIREAEILFNLDHPSIVKVRNIRMDVPTPYLEMEFVDGFELESRINVGPLPIADALPLFRQIADALAYLHSMGVRHRDIKPANILVQRDGVVKIVDFGIATESAGAQLTGAGQTFGSIAYVPPEWLDAARGDPVRWDIYSAGTVFWELLCGRQAFPVTGHGTVQQEILRILTDKQRRPFLEIGPLFPEGLRSLVADMTRSDWRGRLATAEEARDRLDELLGGPPARAAEAPVAPARAESPVTPPPSPPVAVPSSPAPTEAAPGIDLPRAGARARFRHTLVPLPGMPELATSHPVGPSPEPAAALRRRVTAETPEPLARSLRHRTGPAGRLLSAARVWRPMLPGATSVAGSDPTYSTGESKTTRWLEVRWDSPKLFAEWCRTQIENYMLVIHVGLTPLPTHDEVRVLLSHGDVVVDCVGRVQAASPSTVAYRLDIEALQMEKLRRWRGAWERSLLP